MARYAKSLGFVQRETAPATPAEGNVEVYVKADGKLYKKDDTGTESEVGGGDTGSVAWTDFSASAELWWDVPPSGVTIPIWKYRVINGICYFTISIVATDGNDATQFSTTLPENPTSNIYLAMIQYTSPFTSIMIPAIVSTFDNSLSASIQTATDGQQFVLRVSGFYPV